MKSGIRKSILDADERPSFLPEENPSRSSHQPTNSMDMEFFSGGLGQTSSLFINTNPNNSVPGRTSPTGGATSPTATLQTEFPNYEPVVDEIPLYKELGIEPREILYKTLFVLNPFSSQRRKLSSANAAQSSDNELLEQKDLAGPLLFCLALGMVLLLRGKVHFGYIYGVGTVGCLAVYLLLNLMSPKGIDMQRTVSILGYSLLPMVFLALANTFLPLLPIQSASWAVGKTLLSWLAVAWSTWSATGLFVATLKMFNHTWLLAYPIGLVYATFALITIF